MLFLRSLLYFITSSIVLTVLVIIAIIFIPASLKARYFVLSKWSMFCMFALRVFCNIKLEVIGKENIPKQPCVIISNHQSTWETLGFQQVFPHQTWVLKKELLYIPVFGWGLALLKPIVIDRGEKLKALKKVISQGAERLKEGICVVIFPEGTRQPYGKLGVYQNGGVAIAKKTNSLLLPVYHNAGKVWPKGSFLKHPGTITVVIGKPITSEKKQASKLTKEIRDWAESQAKNY